MLFLGWLIAAFVVVGVINVYLRFFGRSKAKGSGDGGGRVGTGSPGEGESCQWINSVFSWLYLHHDNTPEFVEAWLRALNEQARKEQTGDVQVKFDRIQAGSLPPKFTRINTEVGPRDSLTLHAAVEATDMALLLSTLQQTGQNIKVSNCDATIHKLHGNLKVYSHYRSEEIDITANFTTPPEVKLQVKPRSTQISIDNATLEAIVRKAVCGAITKFTVSPKGGFVVTSLPKEERLTPQSALGTLSSAAPGTKSFSLRDRRLLVKVIKANALGDKDFGCSEPYCNVQLDEPLQKHTTSVVKNTSNPFWDEQFLFDMDDHTKQLKFEVFDRAKPPGDDFLGKSNLQVLDLKRMPSSRQIVPLQGKPGGTSITAGSITVEFLFMEPAEAQQMQLPSGHVSQAESLSPRRHIDTNRSVLPGGTVVTTTTTTTQKPKEGRLDASYNESPARIQKTDSTGTFPRQAEVSPISSTSSTLGAPDSTSTTSQAQVRWGAGAQEAQPRQGQPNIMVTHAGGTIARPGPNQPMTNENTTQYEGYDRGVSPSASGTQPEQKEKKKGFAHTLRKRFSRSKKPRSHSADRAGSLREENLLHPPGQSGTKTTDQTEPAQLYKDDLDSADVPEGNLRKSRSHSFSNSLKRIFRKKKKDYPSSRESSVSRASTRGYDDPARHSPQLSAREYGSRGSHDYSRDTSRNVYSTSVPANSPLFDQYGGH